MVTKDYRKVMLEHIHNREDTLNGLNADAEITNIGDNIGLTPEQSYEVFRWLADQDYIDTGRIFVAGDNPDKEPKFVGYGANKTQVGRNIRVSPKGKRFAEIK